MKKLAIIAALSALMTLPALAEDKGGLKTDEAPPPPHELDKGYRGVSDAKVMSIQEAKGMHDGATVSLQGNLVEDKGNDTYLFRDKSGQVDVMIPKAVFRGNEVNPGDLVSVSGTLDKKQKPLLIRVHQFLEE